MITETILLRPFPQHCWGEMLSWPVLAFPGPRFPPNVVRTLHFVELSHEGNNTSWTYLPASATAGVLATTLSTRIPMPPPPHSACTMCVVSLQMQIQMHKNTTTRIPPGEVLHNCATRLEMYTQGIKKAPPEKCYPRGLYLQLHTDNIKRTPPAKCYPTALRH